MLFSFPDGSPEKMGYRYATFQDPGSRPEDPNLAAEIEKLLRLSRYAR
jgi:hypothetical protein